MGLTYGLKAIHQATASDRPHILGHNTARSVSEDLLLDVWNGATNASRVLSINKDGTLYSAALTEGDVLYAVAGGVTGVKRLDSLAIGAANAVMTSSGTAPQWSTSLTIVGITASGTITAGGLITASAGAAVTDGNLYVGTDDSVRGLLRIYSSATTGGRLVLYCDTGASIDNYSIRGLDDDLDVLQEATTILRYVHATSSWDFTGDVTVGNDLNIAANFNHDGSFVGFYGATPGAKPTITGSRGGNAALADLLTELANLGLITDSSS